MCDALSRNISKDLETILANCLTHGRRNFVEVVESFPDEVAFVIDKIALVYKNDDTAKKWNLTLQERLILLQKDTITAAEFIDPSGFRLAKVLSFISYQQPFGGDRSHPQPRVCHRC
jgi:hypothetical protein